MPTEKRERSVSSVGAIIRGNLRLSGRYGGPAGFCYLDFVEYWLHEAIRYGNADDAFRWSRELGHFLIPIVEEVQP